MKVELTIDHNQELPDAETASLGNTPIKRLQNHLNECSLVRRCTYPDGPTVYGGGKEARRGLKSTSSRHGKAQITGFINLACNEFPVWRGGW